MKTLQKLLAVVLMATATQAPTWADDVDDAIKASEAMQEGRLIKRDSLFDRHSVIRVQLSPNGEKLAFIKPTEKFNQLWMHDVATGENIYLFTSEILQGLDWSGDGSHLIMRTNTGVATAPIDDASSPIEVVTIDTQTHDVYHGVDPNSPQHFFVSLFNKGEETWTLYRIDMDGNRTPLYTGSNKIYDFVTESEGPITFMLRPHGSSRSLIRISDDGEREILKCSYEESCSIASYNHASGQLYLYGRTGGEFQQLLSLNMETGELTPVHAEPEGRFDINLAQFSPKSGEPILVEYNTDYRESYGLGATYKKHVENIKQSLNSSVIYIQPTAQNRWLVIDSNPIRPRLRYYLYNTNTGTFTRPLEGFIKANPAKEDPVIAQDLSIRIPFQHVASDGLKLQGYLTLPRGKKISEAPMVVVPHGGPWNRVHGRFNSVAQLLANRGYIVYEPNFRASTGFGKTYMLSSNRDFGDGRVQQDIIDGTMYLLERGVGHPDKLAMFGHSFGGFSTMAALAFTPEMFQVGIAGAPPPSLSRTMKYYMEKQDQTRAGVLRAEIMALLAVDINDPADVERLYNQSPMKHLDKVTKPMYIVAGEKDRRVDILDVREYAIQLEANGVKVGMLTDKNEGHNFCKPLATEAYFYLLETVLAHHLQGRHQPITERKLERYLNKNMVMGELPTTPSR